MSDTAAHLVGRVLPLVAIRQWVLSLPFRVRFLCARDPSLLRAVLRLFLREVFRCIRRLLRREGVRGARGGLVTAVQRFGGNLGLNVHLHALVLDGAFARDADGTLQFHELSGLRQAHFVTRHEALQEAPVKGENHLITKESVGLFTKALVNQTHFLERRRLHVCAAARQGARAGRGRGARR
jgi:hypothetical protein